MTIYQRQIPKTGKTQYVSGRYALNIPGETSGDWHFTTVWFSRTPQTVELWGDGQERNTNGIFGNFGIADRSADIRKAGLVTVQGKIFAANHYRAILDLMVAGAINGSMSLVIGATMDYLDTEEQKQYVLRQARKAVGSSSLTDNQKRLIDEWIQKESRNFYRGDEYAI